MKEEVLVTHDPVTESEEKPDERRSERVRGGKGVCDGCCRFPWTVHQ